MLRSILFSICFIITLAPFAMAGSGSSTIFGAVHDNNTPLIGAEITIIGEATYTSGSTYTNENGVYFFRELPADEYIVRAIPQPVGVYKDGTANVLVEEGKEKEVNFPMKKK